VVVLPTTILGTGKGFQGLKPQSCSARPQVADRGGGLSMGDFQVIIQKPDLTIVGNLF